MVEASNSRLRRITLLVVVSARPICGPLLVRAIIAATEMGIDCFPPGRLVKAEWATIQSV